ncbi:MAG TPA: SHOCT domain-containing protein [Bacteroidetes bacterium]|nr:SHOCT domain-containing protein [Bacteroidota bacterium]
MMFGMGIFGALFWIAVIVLIIWGVNQIVHGDRAERPGSQRMDPESPLEILKRRYARGEVSRSEFEQMREELRR